MGAWIQLERGGSDMKRQVVFKQDIDRYILVEDSKVIFEIIIQNLKFDSAKFYEGVYKNKNVLIELTDGLNNQSDRIGKYVFDWLNEIISAINTEFLEASNSLLEESNSNKVIPLYDLFVCAGNGIYIDGNVDYENFSTTIQEADYALKINGKSMEPTIMDGSIVLVQKTEEYSDGDIVIVNYNGDSMCKRYKKISRGYNLVPDNSNGNFRTINNRQIKDCYFQGKVVKVLNNK